MVDGTSNSIFDIHELVINTSLLMTLQWQWQLARVWLIDWKQSYGNTSTSQNGSTSLLNNLLEPPTTSVIEWLDTASTATSEIKSVHPFVNLTELVFQSKFRYEIGQVMFPGSLLTILGLCPNLTRLTLPTTILYERTLGQFLGLLSDNLHQLQFLCLSGEGAGLSSSCAFREKLQELICDFEMGGGGEHSEDEGEDEEDEDEDEDEEYEGEDEGDMNNRLFSSALRSLRNSASPSGASRSNITTLTLPFYDNGYPASFLGPLLRDYLPNIVSLVIPRIEDVDDMELCYEDYATLKAFIMGSSGGVGLRSFRNISLSAFKRSCPTLQHITYEFDTEVFDDAALKAFIMGSSGGIGLKSFRVHNFNENCITESLIQYHSSTLEEIELIDCELIGSSDLQNILMACPKLRRFWASPINETGISIDFEDTVSGDWVWLDLRALRLTLNRNEYLQPGMELQNSVAEKVYAQIGRLVKLEELALGWELCFSHLIDPKYFEMDFTHEQGWLAELGGLKNLRHFYVATELWSRMGQSEVEFMNTNWLQLEKITFGDSRMVDVSPH
ncbi:hypothetical protein BGX26_003858, partial [Mortierella sp. AD094]